MAEFYRVLERIWHSKFETTRRKALLQLSLSLEYKLLPSPTVIVSLYDFRVNPWIQPRQEEEMYQKRHSSQKLIYCEDQYRVSHFLLKRGNFSFYSVSGFQQILGVTVEKIRPSGIDGIISHKNLGMEETWKYLLELHHFMIQN